LQLQNNAEHGITPRSVQTAINMGIEDEIAARKFAATAAGQNAEDYATEEYLEELHNEMLAAANLQFERAAELRDRIAQLKGEPTATPQGKTTATPTLTRNSTLSHFSALMPFSGLIRPIN
jgi:excinuclease ABC subunit B